MSARRWIKQFTLLSTLFIHWTAQADVGNATSNEHHSAKQWFIKHYAPVWKNTRSLNIKALTPLYHNQGFMRMGEQLVLWQQPESIELLLQELTRAQWENAQVLSIQASRIGPSTQSLNVVWKSDYKTQTAQISCEWYLLEKLQQWKIIGQRYIGC